ncbi:TetR family transcriptional regulator [Mesorhizobium loti]|nr:TetR/AcrR family transcriptional regulator [Mesorhizobium loti]PLP61064.1 TetR family transcriptional regulator [Mesorhizobium loti]
MATETKTPPSDGVDQKPARARIIDAAFVAFGVRGYAQTSMLEIATRAKVSKRELYALVGNKHDMLVACITERTGRMRPTAEMPEPSDRESLAAVLSAFGERLLCEVSDPVVLGVFRLAIAEAERAPEIAQALDSIGRAAARKELAAILEHAQSHSLLGGDTAEMTERFLALLWGDLMMKLLLCLAEPPVAEEVRRRARDAVSGFLRLQPTRS